MTSAQQWEVWRRNETRGPADWNPRGRELKEVSGQRGQECVKSESSRGLGREGCHLVGDPSR